MAQKLTANMPDTLSIGDGFQIVFAAVDPTTGADVSGVTVSSVNIAAEASGDASVVVANPILIGINA